MPSMSLTAVGALLVLFVGLHLYHKNVYPSRRLPPGPEGHLIFGNLLQIPPKGPWLKFQEWYKLYGRISSNMIESVLLQG